MKINKLIILTAMAATCAASCHKIPSDIDRDGEYLVYTSHSEDADFSKYRTFTVVDSILVIGTGAEPEYARDGVAAKLVSEFESMMTSCGYTRLPVEEKENADLGIQLTYVVDTRYFVDYVDPYWWLGYPGYWTSSYWGNWGGWYYPYPVTYSYSTCSLLADMADLTSSSGDDALLPVVWHCFIDGSVGSYGDYLRMQKAIRQSFEQSEYLKVK